MFPGSPKYFGHIMYSVISDQKIPKREGVVRPSHIPTSVMPILIKRNLLLLSVSMEVIYFISVQLFGKFLPSILTSILPSLYFIPL